MRHDHLIARFEKASEALAKAALAVQGSLRKGRAAAFCMAADYLELIKDHYEEFVTFFAGKNTKEWLDKHFAPLVDLGEEDYMELLCAIQRGLTKDRYVKEGTRPHMREVAQRTSEDCAPRGRAPLNEQVSRMRGEIKELRADQKTMEQLREDLKEMTKRCIAAEATIAKMKKMVGA